MFSISPYVSCEDIFHIIASVSTAACRAVNKNINKHFDLIKAKL